MSQSHTNPEICLVSVGHFSEAYPNTFYKIELLKEQFGSTASNLTYDLGAKNTSSSISKNKLFSTLVIAYNSLKVFIKLLTCKPKIVYIAYPGLLIALLFCLVPKKRRPIIILDLFISIYDTVCLDRKLVTNKYLSNLLKWLEAKACRACDIVVTDTEENSAFYSTVLGIEENRFHAVNLTIPPAYSETIPKSRNENKNIQCFFSGTFVPLQGIKTIAEAAALLQETNSDIELVIVGDGQDSTNLEHIIESKNLKNTRWIKNWQSTEDIIKLAESADICLGIFGSTEKTERVWPLKNYIYMAMGKAIITGSTETARRLQSKSENASFLTVETGNAGALASKIIELSEDPKMLEELAVSSLNFYKENLSNNTAINKLLELIRSTQITHLPRETL